MVTFKKPYQTIILLFVFGPCHGAGDESQASYHGGRVSFHVSPCGICGGQIGSVFPNTSVWALSFIPRMLYSHFIHVKWTYKKKITPFLCLFLLNSLHTTSQCSTAVELKSFVCHVLSDKMHVSITNIVVLRSILILLLSLYY
jgi:hypothetical protein